MNRPAIVLAMEPSRTEHVLPDAILRRLDTIGRLLDPEPLQRLDDARARRLLSEAEILITGWGAAYVGPEIAAVAPRLRLIVHAAGTVKGIIDEAIFDAGITVSHSAEANAVPVAEFTLAAILFAGKRAFRFRDLYVADRNRDRTYPMQREAIGNYGRTLGIIGASRIGRRVIELLKPFEYRLLLFDPMVDAAEAAGLGAEKVELDELMRRADIVSLHAPSLPSTQHMIDASRLSLLKDGATLINTARGILIDEAALLSELKTGRIDAVIDVTDPEIPEAGSLFYDLPNVFLTPHIAGAIGLERARLGAMAADEVERFTTGRPLLYQIRRQDLENIA
ncbi:D-2-hydroxyacid dehydrogenase protein [Rhizobium phaseoli]|uniref:Hydroxyacid dehydrogenase n=2 Tax=Rhizobium TaxID=379 RepID=A0A192T390_9HYPH|nr:MULTISPECIES: hydroxyacid dehydrogenase [Rhizobium]ACE89077.1 probable D-2-hydroxyacid dehydrogenase protein [Rhizobium etli CIAT 652]ANL25968.1 D-2-hydroxyacid dehydrogenase protein [Rhizobium phaseoli]ANL38536.1 D-2-hydroxyacid dehydrogenase protein [Rhizobium phaseoli]ANL51285.1 D-2-hydroxyacid dehydrogenase protein [Rhizobium phaseoli]ANL57525.1 D-2-hydroxyacid dehydrogenase protein [Rhizobium phaseoli]